MGIAKECARQLIFDKPEYDLYYEASLGADSYRKLFLEDGDNSCESILDYQYAKNMKGTFHDMADKVSAGYLWQPRSLPICFWIRMVFLLIM